MIKHILFSVIFYFIFSASAQSELKPLVYEYNSRSYKCKIDDFEIENDLDLYPGASGCIISGSEFSYYQSLRKEWRNDPHKFKEVQLVAAQKKIDYILKYYNENALLKNEKIRDQLRCYSTIFDISPTEYKPQKEAVRVFVSEYLPKIFELKLFKEDVFDAIFEKVLSIEKFESYEIDSLYSRNPEFRFHFFNRYLSKSGLSDLLKAHRVRLAKIFNDFKLFKDFKDSKRMKDFVIGEFINNDELKYDAYPFIEKNAEDPQVYPLVEKFILQEKDPSKKIGPPEIRTDRGIAIALKVLRSKNISNENKCKTIDYYLNFMEKTRLSIHLDTNIGFREIGAIDLKCNNDYKNKFRTFDVLSEDFSKKWCTSNQDLQTCLASVTNNDTWILSYKPCERSSDCQEINIADCGYIYVNKTFPGYQKDKLEFLCKQKKYFSYSQTGNKPVCLYDRCERSRLK
ncbi:MAG: hypothetical protein ACXVLQ_16720 [Bacteriovorax sp.]